MNKDESPQIKAICNGCPYSKNLPECNCTHKRAMIFASLGLGETQ